MSVFAALCRICLVVSVTSRISIKYIGEEERSQECSQHCAEMPKVDREVGERVTPAS